MCIYVFVLYPCIAFPCSPAEERVQVLAQQWPKKSIAMTSRTAKNTKYTQGVFINLSSHK